jgi:hypothetical protein
LAGRSTQAECAERVETAYAARVGDELALTQKGLPNVAIAPAVGPRRKQTRLNPAVFSHVIKRGSWRLRRWSLAASVFSDLDLDVRGAERDTTHSVITVLVARQCGRRSCVGSAQERAAAASTLEPVQPLGS